VLDKCQPPLQELAVIALKIAAAALVTLLAGVPQISPNTQHYDWELSGEVLDVYPVAAGYPESPWEVLIRRDRPEWGGDEYLTFRCEGAQRARCMALTIHQKITAFGYVFSNEPHGGQRLAVRRMSPRRLTTLDGSQKERP
jgi:hypothetical protein